MSRYAISAFRSHVLLGLLIPALNACAAAHSSRTPRPSRSANVVGRAELAPFADRSVFEAMSALRPQLMAISIRGDRDGPTVYLDGVRIGDVHALHAIRISNVSEVSWLNAADATTRFGLGNTRGAILVSTRSPGRGKS